MTILPKQFTTDSLRSIVCAEKNLSTLYNRLCDCLQYITLSAA